MIPPAAAPPPPVALATAIHADRWAEVRAITERCPAPLAPSVALAAARAARMLGEPARAAEIIRAALPRAGVLGGILRLEGARARLAAGLDPWPMLEPLFAREAPAAQRRAAAALLRDGWERLPVAVVRAQTRGRLPKRLRRDLDAAIAERTSDVALAARLVDEGGGDAAALRAARFLATRPPPGGRMLRIGEVLLAGGAWREARSLLRDLPEAPAVDRAHLAWLRGRAAYRLGDLEAAAASFAAAFDLATTAPARFQAAVQRARVAEIAGDFSAAVGFWDAARAAAPAEVEGWDGGARALAALGEGRAAAQLILAAPPAVARHAGGRTAAVLLARGELKSAAQVLVRLPADRPPVRVLRAWLARRQGKDAIAAEELGALLADRRAGAWRDAVTGLLPTERPLEGPPIVSREAATLARIAANHGVGPARAALATSLSLDPAWAALAAGTELPSPRLDPPLGDLLAAGFESEAASLFAHAFPCGSPAELAWTASFLATWGDGPAALAAGEALWSRLGNLPASFLPPTVLVRISPVALTADLAAVARSEDVPATWLYGIIRQESRFDAGARSQAGALGLAQFVPEALARLGASERDATDPRRALHLAGREVARLRAALGSDLPGVAAAYNAGEGVVRSWVAELGPGSDGVLLAVMIPYAETSGYVVAVAEGARLAAHLE